MSERPLIDLSNVGCGAIILAIIVGFFGCATIVGIADAIASCFGGHPQ